MEIRNNVKKSITENVGKLERTVTNRNKHELTVTKLKGVSRVVASFTQATADVGYGVVTEVGLL